MPVEIEAKMKVESFDAVRQSLARAGAQRVGSVLETNTFFDTATQSLVKVDKGLRLRIARDSETGKEEYIVTVKGAVQEGPLKSRAEFEVGVENPAQMTAILEQLGFAPELSFEKRRETWKLGGCNVELDELPILGRFVEIEGPDEQTVLRVREDLHLAQLPPIKTGYISMLAQYVKQHDPGRRTITFGKS